MESQQDLSGKKLALIEVAERLIARKGYEATSVRDIASEAGVNVAMISYYFGSKDGLFTALIQQRIGHVQLHMEELLSDGTLSSGDKLNRLIDNYLDRLFMRSDFHKIMIQENIHMTESPIRNVVLEYKRRSLGLVQSLITQGVENGSFRNGIDAQLLMITLIGTANHVISTRQFLKEIYSQEQESDEAFEQALKTKLSTHLKNLFHAYLSYETK